MVQYVHFIGEEFYARVVYEENGDTEDTTIRELKVLTHAGRATQDGFLKMGSVRRGVCGQVSSINKPLITTCERTPVLESAREMNKVRVVGVNSSSMVIETVTYRKTETLPFVFETKLELFIEPARPLQSNLHSPPVIVRKAVSGPPGLPKPDSTFFEQAETTTQLWHIVQVVNDCLGTVASEYTENELAMVRFFFLSFSVRWGLLLVLLDAFNFRLNQWMEIWLFFGLDPPLLERGNWNLRGRAKFLLHFSNFN